MADTEQEGVSPASAGGASAPGPWDVGHSPATGGRNLYVRSADGDIYVGVIFEPADALRIVEVMNAAERPQLADPRDAEIAQLRTALARYQKRMGDDLLLGGKLVERIRKALRESDNSTCTRASMDGVVGPVGRLCDEIEQLRRRLKDVNAEANLWSNRAGNANTELTAIREALGPLHGDRNLGDTDAEVIATLRAAFVEASQGVNRQAARANELEVGVEHWQRLAEQRWQQLQQYEDDLTGARRVADLVTAERDRLRAELDLIGEQQSDPEAERLREALRDALEGLEDMLPYVPEYFVEKWGHRGYIERADVALKRAQPAEPRRWVAGDAEPEVGTRVRNLAGDTLIRHAKGWHYYDNGYEPVHWADLLDNELVEEVSIDG